ncbi:hypothetical protein AQJ66_35155 [Streptomyces bungoensis]|uniref:Uncharacterized protein n=1 Tax=Streptomyces bungoensis TaxID=285568 RepID=A0A124I116_9ACTN|nr:hypothetical protein AQJ66_35155 [Streptomyces bungoensis]
MPACSPATTSSHLPPSTTGPTSRPTGFHTTLYRQPSTADRATSPRRQLDNTGNTPANGALSTNPSVPARPSRSSRSTASQNRPSTREPDDGTTGRLFSNQYRRCWKAYVGNATTRPPCPACTRVHSTGTPRTQASAREVRNRSAPP